MPIKVYLKKQRKINYRVIEGGGIPSKNSKLVDLGEINPALNFLIIK